MRRRPLSQMCFRPLKEFQISRLSSGSIRQCLANPLLAIPRLSDNLLLGIPLGYDEEARYEATTAAHAFGCRDSFVS